MATTTTMNTKRTINSRSFYTENRTLYWVIGALILAGLIIFFSMGRNTADRSVMTQPAATAPAPTVVEQSTAPGNVPPAGTDSSVDTSAAGAGAIDMENSNLETDQGAATRTSDRPEVDVE